MTQQERDMMVERYIDGNMSQSERHEFLDLLDSDEKMRQTLRAETAINNAIKIDRTATTMPSAPSRERFLTMLATVAPEGAAPVGATISSTNCRTSFSASCQAALSRMRTVPRRIPVCGIALNAVPEFTAPHTNDSPARGSTARVNIPGRSVISRPIA